MADDRSPSQLAGILEPDSRVGPDTLLPKDHATAGLRAKYSQAGPRAGTPKRQGTSSLVLEASGTQSADGHLELLSRRPGMPGPEGCAYAWRDRKSTTLGGAGDSATNYKGWDGPQLVTGRTPLLMTTATTNPAKFWPDVVRLRSGKLLAVYSQNATKHLMFALYDPSTSSWALSTHLPTGVDFDIEAATLVELPETGRVLCYYTSRSQDQVDAVFTDDEATSWSTAGHSLLQEKLTSTTVRQMRARYDGRNVLLLVAHGSSNDMAQYASRDTVTFDAVVTDWRTPTSEDPELPNLVPLPFGGFLVVYHDADSGSPNYKARRCGSAYEALTGITAVDVANGAGSAFKAGLTAWADEDGVIYAALHTTGTSQDLIPYRTLDYGDAWEAFAQTAFFSGDEATGYLHTYAAESLGGRTFLLTRWDAATASSYWPRSVGVVELGGFSNHTAPAHVDASDFNDTDYISYADDGGNTSLPGWQYLPIELPGSIGAFWTVTGAGTESMTTDWTYEIVTTSGQTRIISKERDTSSHGTPSRHAVALAAEFTIKVPTGGDSTTLQVATQLRLSNGNGSNASTYLYEVSVRMSASGLRLYDDTAGTQLGSTLGVVLTTERLVRVAINKDGKAELLVADDAHVREWSERTSGTASAATNASVVSRVRWGHLAAAASTSEWGTLGVCSWAGRHAPETTSFVGEPFSNPEDLHLRAYPTRPALVHDGVHIWTVDGPTYEGELFDIKTDYDFPVKHLFPGSTPSPQDVWRATGETETILPFDLDALFGKSRLRSSTLGMFIVGANFPSAVLEGSTNGTTWSTIATADATDGFTSLAFRRDGRMVDVDTGTTHTAKRYFFEHAHAGDVLDMGQHGDPAVDVVRRISTNSAGAWTDSTTARPRLQLLAEDLDGTEPSSGTAAKVRRRNFGVLVHGYTDTYRYIRVRIPAATTPQGYFTAAKLLVGPVLVFGWPHDRGWERARTFNVAMNELRDGRRLPVELGPRRRRYTFAWTNTTLQATQVLQDDPVPDYVTGYDGGPAIAARRDTLHQVLGLLDRLGSKSRVVVLRRVRRGSGDLPMVVDDEWMYAMPVTDPQLDHMAGAAAAEEANKLNPVTFEEEV